MKLSIITINYNNVEGLRKTLVSVAAQTYHNIEHIVIDGASTDGSVEVIKDYAAKVKSRESRVKSIVWTSEPDKGIYNAMNKGIEIALGRRIVNSFNRSEPVEDKNKGIHKATGDYVWILNSGDCVASPTTVEQMMDALETSNSLNSNSLIPILLGNILHAYGDGRKVREGKKVATNASTPQPVEASMLTFYCGTIPHDAAFVRRDLFEKYGYFDETMKICADWKLYLDMIALGGVVPMYVDIDVVNFDMSGVSNTNNELRLAERRAYLEQVLPATVLKDYDAYAFPIHQYNRLRKHHLWGPVYFLERVLFKLEKWHVLR